jgi:hypothetical protein
MALRAIQTAAPFALQETVKTQTRGGSDAACYRDERGLY